MEKEQKKIPKEKIEEMEEVLKEKKEEVKKVLKEKKEKLKKITKEMDEDLKKVTKEMNEKLKEIEDTIQEAREELNMVHKFHVHERYCMLFLMWFSHLSIYFFSSSQELRDLSGDEVKKMTEVDDKPLEHAMSCLKLDEALKDPTDASANAEVLNQRPKRVRKPNPKYKGPEWVRL